MRASLEYAASLESQLADAKAKPVAKGDEMICVHDWDYSPDSADTLFTCLKCGTELYAVDSFNRLNMLEHYVAQFRKEGDEYRAQLAARDALIERLVEAGEGLTDFILIDTRSDEEKWRKWIEVRDEWQAMKKESVE